MPGPEPVIQVMNKVTITAVPPEKEPAGSPRILVVDDDQFSCRLLERTLISAGFLVNTCLDGSSALGLVRSLKPDLLLLDFKMPGMSGVEVCIALRTDEDAAIKEVPVIMLTGHSTEADEISCWNAGANDFLSKPASRSALVMRINTQLRLHSLKNELRVQNDELSLWRVEREADLEAARSTQQVILPTETPGLPGWKIETLYEPMIQVGGDIFGWRPGPDGSWMFWLADATGHGASAALFTTLAAFLFNSVTMLESSPGALLERVNERFYSVFAGHSMMSACCLWLHPDGRGKFANAGHPPLLIHRQHGVVDAVTDGQTMIGIHQRLNFTDAEIEIGPGDSALLFTDGLFSLIGRNGSRMEESVVRSALAGTNGSDVNPTLVTDIKNRSKEGAFLDDVAVLAMRRL
jgi:sigma-B regulation protein RsbU (phosphoserine phosphatase)